MKFNLTNSVLQPNGESFKNPDNGNDFTVKDAIINGLGSLEQNLKPEQKIKRYEIAIKVVAMTNECDLSSDEIVEIKKSMENSAPTFVYGFVSKFLG